MTRSNDVLSHAEMCLREAASLQQGMMYAPDRGYSILLMSVRPGSPYRDQIEEDGTVVIYEGHDLRRGPDVMNPKAVDQPEFYSSGALTQNGRFHRVAQAAKAGESPRVVRIYEKIRSGIWSYNGHFHLVDSWREHDGIRFVFKFKLIAIQDDDTVGAKLETSLERRRIIPTEVKIQVWERDEGKCVTCGATDELHFDHVVPYSRGGTSVLAENVQLLCARHNLAKGGRIE